MKSACGVNCHTCQFGKERGCQGCPCSSCFIYEYIKTGGKEAFDLFKQKLCEEINALSLDGLPTITDLNPLIGEFINLKYPLPNHLEVSFLNNQEIYLANQVTSPFSEERCFGIVANMRFILIVEYGIDGENPEILLYTRR